MKYLVWTILFLIICTITDLVERKIYLIFCLANWLGMMVVLVWYDQKNFSELIWGMIPAALLFVIHMISRQSIGMGDVWVVFTVGSALGVIITTEILVWGLGLCAVFGTVAIAIHKLNRKSRIPMVPFLLAGEIITIIAEGL